MTSHSLVPFQIFSSLSHNGLHTVRHHQLFDQEVYYETEEEGTDHPRLVHHRDNVTFH